MHGIMGMKTETIMLKEARKKYIPCDSTHIKLHKMQTYL